MLKISRISHVSLLIAWVAVYNANYSNFLPPPRLDSTIITFHHFSILALYFDKFSREVSHWTERQLWTMNFQPGNDDMEIEGCCCIG